MMPRFLLLPTKYRILFLLTVSVAFAFLLLSHLVKAELFEETRQTETQPNTLKLSNQTIDEQSHTLVGSYYSFRNNLTAILMLNNKGGLPLVVTPTFYSSGGTRLQLAPITVREASYAEFDLRELLANAGGEFQEGNLRVTYQGKNMQLGSQIKVIDEAKSLIWEEQFVEPAAKYESSRLEGVWWMPSNNCDTKFIISNTTDAPVTATITIDGTSPNQQSPTTIQLTAHETRVFDVIRDLVRKTNGTLHTTGGVSISHTGTPGAVMARMLISKASKGYSATMNFIDPEKTASSKWHGAGLHLGKINNQKLQQILVARNVGNQTTTVSGKVQYTNNNGEVVAIPIPSTNIAPNATKKINLQSSIDAANVPSNVKYGGLEMNYTTPKGSVVMSAVSVSQDDNQVFQVPLYDPQKVSSSAGGYPWKTDGDYTTVVYLKNDTDEPQQYIVRMVYQGGYYMLGLKDLKAREMVAIDFREFRDNQTADARGNVIPLNIGTGQILWSVYGEENYVLNGRSEQISLADGVSSTYDCRNCCPDSTIVDRVTPGVSEANVGDLIDFFREGRIENCYGQATPIFFSNGNWTSSNSAIAIIGSSGNAQAMSAGMASLSASWLNDEWFDLGGSRGCRLIRYPADDSGEMMVRPRITSISPALGLIGNTTRVSINGSGFRSSATISAGIGISVSVVSITSTRITADFIIAADAMDGNHAVTITISGQTSNSNNFFVQIPFAITAVSVSPADGDCPTGLTGYAAQVLYQVVDQERQPIMKAGMTPEERFFVNGVPNAEDYLPFATPPTTDANGRFLDIPIVTCSNAPGTNPCFDVRQVFRIKYPTSEGERLSFVPTETIRRDCKLGIRVTVNNFPNSQTFTLGTVN